MSVTDRREPGTLKLWGGETYGGEKSPIQQVLKGSEKETISRVWKKDKGESKKGNVSLPGKKVEPYALLARGKGMGGRWGGPVKKPVQKRDERKKKKNWPVPSSGGGGRTGSASIDEGGGGELTRTVCLQIKNPDTTKGGKTLASNLHPGRIKRFRDSGIAAEEKATTFGRRL